MDKKIRLLTHYRPPRALLVVVTVFLLGLGLRPAAPALAACGSATVVTTEAQLNTAIDDFNSQAGPCAYEIEFGADVTLTADTQLILNSNSGVSLLIDGAGYTLDGNHAGETLRIGYTAAATIDRLTIANSSDDGIGTSNVASLRVSRSTVRNSGSDGIEYDDGALVVVESAILDNDDSGIDVFTSLVASSATVINSTIAGNGGGAVLVNFSTATLTHATIAGNDGGLSLYQSVGTVNNSILADNGWDCSLDSSSVDVNSSLVQVDDPDFPCGVSDSVDGNIVGHSPKLLPLGDYGGPTLTMPSITLSGGVTFVSPGVNAGDDALSVDETAATLTNDQRGTAFPRNIPGAVDMGAVEGPVAVVCPTFPMTVADEVELDLALVCYNGATTAGAYTVNLGADINLTISTLPIDNATAGVSLVIEGHGHTIDGQDTAGVLPIEVAGDTTVTINDATITGGNAINGDEGGGIRNLGDLTLNGVHVDGNTTDDDGGGIFNEDGATMAINNSIVSGNSATSPNGDGGGISNDGAMAITDSTISENSAEGDEDVWAGGIWNEGVMTITRSSVISNTIEATNYEVYGGGIANEANLIIRDSTIAGNEATAQDDTAYGGGIYSEADDEEVNVNGYGTQLTLINSTVSGNSAAASHNAYGGGLYATDFGPCCSNDPVPVTLINTTVAGNSVSASNDLDFGGAGAFFELGDINNHLTVTIHNSILADSIIDGAPGGDCVRGTDANLVFESLHSLYEDTDSGACELAAAYPDGDGNIVGVDPVLGALTNNGGTTDTHLPDVFSAVIDAGDNALAVDENTTALAADQRGYLPRVVDGTVDMGSVELYAEAPGAAAVFMSTTLPGTTGDGLPFGSEDILKWDGSAWSMWFDGSAAGLTPTGKWKHNINAFWIPDASADDVLISFTQNRRPVPGLVDPVDGMDLVYWDGSTFSFWFDGSDVGLTNKTQEKIDGLHVLPGSQSPIGSGCLSYLLISTQGPGKVPNYSGGQLKFQGEDVVGFCATSLGENTAGLWHMVLDGSVEGMPRNATDSISVSADGNTLYLTTQRTFNVDSASGGHSMVYAWDFGTGTFSGPYFSAPANGLNEKVDGLQVEGDLGN